MREKVYIILLNYKNWQDTLECLLSIDKLSYEQFEVVIVDNFSRNDSLGNIKASLDKNSTSYKIHFIELSENGGFAKGNNAGLAFAQEKGDGAYYWVLNNDTTLDMLALEYLVLEGEADKSKGLEIGVYGSKLMYYSHPEIIQAIGGRYNKWFGTLKEIGNKEVDRGQYDNQTNPNVLIGAALFFSKEFLNDVGMIGEDYFIYFEEIDLAERAKRKGWGLKVVTSSVVYHKQGVTTQASGMDNNSKSKMSDFYYFRNRLRITCRYFPLYLPTVYASYVFTAFNRIKRGQWDRLELIWRIIWRFRTIKWKSVD